MHISQRGVEFIAGFEGWSSRPYWDPYGHVWTRGFGETEGITSSSPPISYAEGLARLRHLIEQRYEWAIRGLGVDFNQNEWDALCSFVWNLGAGIFTGALRSALQHRDFRRATEIMLAYDHAGGVRLEGLTRRRRAEAALFRTPAATDRYHVLLPSEKALVRTLVAYRRHPRWHPVGIPITLRRLVVKRKEVWAAAQADIRRGMPRREAWGRRNRAARYRLLWSLTGGAR